VPAATLCNVEIYGSDNLLGGPRGADRNIIAGAPTQLCVKTGANEIHNNRIGTSADGTADAGDGGIGVQLGIAAAGSLVRDNLVSGRGVGIQVYGDDNILQGNRVGMNAGGDAAIPNSTGVNVEGGDDNTMAAPSPKKANLISGNASKACSSRAVTPPTIPSRRPVPP
jgi:hypothetical protein